MSLNITIPKNINDTQPKISVIGIGGAGGNAVNTMINANVQNIEFIVANTDGQALSRSLTKRQIQLGKNLTLGLGAGSNAETGKMAAEESIEEIMSELGDVNMLFIATGMGGGTGSGAAPVIAKAAKEQGILTVAVVTKPFDFEGKKRMDVAEVGLSLLKENVDTLIVIPNQNLFKIANEKTTFAEAFKLADDVLYQGVCGITDLITNPGMINLDFADIKSIMGNMGKAMMGTGESSGEERALQAAQAALNNPLLDESNIKGARSILLNIQGGPDMALFEVDEAASKIRNEVDENANIIFGSSIDENLEGIIRVSVVATGIDYNKTIHSLENEKIENAQSNDLLTLNNQEIDEDKSSEEKFTKDDLSFSDEQTEQFDLESQINEMDVKNEDQNISNEDSKKYQISDKEHFSSMVEDQTENMELNNKSNNIFKKLSSFFVEDKVEENKLEPNLSSKKEKHLKDTINKNSSSTPYTENNLKDIEENNNVFKQETVNREPDHQIDLIKFDQEDDEIDEKVLEIPAFLRRQAN